MKRELQFFVFMKQVDKTCDIGIEFMQGLVRRVDVETEWNLKSTVKLKEGNVRELM